MKTERLISCVQRLGVSLWVEGDDLHYNAPKGVLTQALRAELVERKSEILAFLCTAQGSVGSRVTPSLTDEAGPEPDESPIAPRTPVEETLAEIWAQVLGVKQVGIQDNFFELGGDEFLVMHVIDEAERLGLSFSPQQLLEHQTIVELAAVEGIAPAVGLDEGLVADPAVFSVAQMPIPNPGEYESHSQPGYDGWTRTSQYISVRDGTKLAVDIFRPVRDGEVVEIPLPVIWAHNRYHRASTQASRLETVLDDSPWLQRVLRHGYVVGAVDVRGGGASPGTRQGPFALDEAEDAFDITEWFAEQPWCDGNVGMYGRSFLGITQYMAASTAPSHLKAIFPEMAMFDLYSFVYPGGVFRDDYIARWSRAVKESDAGVSVVPVDKDSDGSALAEAIEEHRHNVDVFEVVETLCYRNSCDNKTNSTPFIDRSPSSYLSGVRRSGVAIYCLAGWFDCWPRDALLWFKNQDNPQKIVVGPWYHRQSTGFDAATEHLRWYDYWLKGIDNGIMDEAPICYYTIGALVGEEWRFAWKWPLSNVRPSDYFFHGGASGSVDSVNDGLLRTNIPTSTSGKDDYIADYTATSGRSTRWDNGLRTAGFGYSDMTRNDVKGLTYTSLPLDWDIEMTGHPIVHLWITSTVTDGDFFVYLEDVDEHGFSHYVTEGVLRASHRALSPPPFDYLGLPYHRSYAEDVADLPSEPVELVFDLHPISIIFKAGHRIRVTITCADKNNALTPELFPPPTVSVYRNANYASHITLPIIPPVSEDEQTR